MDFKDYYGILGVDAAADAKTIKSAYRKLARKYHPDVSEEDDADERFKEVAEAYEVLKNKDKRAEFDAIRQYGGAQGFQPPPEWEARDFGSAGGEFQGGFSDFFDNIFGQAGHGSQQGHSRQHFAQRGEDVELGMAVFLEDAYHGESRTISYRVPGFDEQGRLSHQDKTLKVKIPVGVTDGERIRLKGQGAPGVGDAPPGDLYLHIQFAEHPLYVVEGSNLTITLPVSPWELILGCKLEVPTLDGSINLSVPANSQAGRKLRVKGRGLGKEGARGDLFVLLRVTVPDQVDNEEQALWQQLSEQSKFDPRRDWGQVR
jgi:curved DNA-binding protein